MNVPTRYQFVISGDISDRVKAAFPDLDALRSFGGCTSLYGPVPNQTRMRSILARLDSLGLTILEMRRLPD